MFGNYLVNNYKIEFPVYDSKMVSCANEIKENKIEEEDIKKAIEYINNNIRNWEEIKNYEYKMFSKEILQERFEKSIEFILNNIK